MWRRAIGWILLAGLITLSACGGGLTETEVQEMIDNSLTEASTTTTVSPSTTSTTVETTTTAPETPTTTLPPFPRRGRRWNMVGTLGH